MRTGPLLILLAAISMGLGCAGTTKAPPQDSQAIFAGFDRNHDGRVSRNEFFSQIRDRKMAEKLFNELDANGDGYISPEEAAAQPALMQQAQKLTEPPQLK